MSAIIAEGVLTFMFLMIILGSTDERAPKGFAPIAIGLRGLPGLNPLVQRPFALGVQHERGPVLRGGRIAGGIELLGIKPADDLSAAAGPQRVVLIGSKLQVMRRVARIDKGVLAAHGLIHGNLTPRPLDRE